jgi:hypothetical protein
MTLSLRRFNSRGLERALEWHDAMPSTGDAGFVDVLVDDDLTESMGTPFEAPSLGDRWHAALAMDTLLAPLVDDGRPVLRDEGLWTWLAFAHLDQLAPLILGVRKPGNWARLILDSANYQRYYRHLLAGPYYIYDAHRDDPERARALLTTPVERPGELVEQFASRQELVRSPGIVGAITDLYLDRSTMKLRPGHGGNNASPGSARRFAMLLQQLDLTYDIFEMPPEAIIGLLPPEFDRFRTVTE